MSRSKTFLLFVAGAFAVAMCLRPAATTKADAATALNTAENVTSVLYLRVTAYASVPNETDNTPFITANGTYVHDGVVASNNLPFGTKIEIPTLFGNKVFTVEDRMNERFKTGIDIWMPNVPQALRFGANYANVLVLDGASSTGLALNSK